MGAYHMLHFYSFEEEWIMRAQPHSIENIVHLVTEDDWDQISNIPSRNAYLFLATFLFANQSKLLNWISWNWLCEISHITTSSAVIYA